MNASGASKWVYQRDESSEISKPVNTEELKLLIRNGEVDGLTLFATDGMIGMKRVADIPYLRELFQSIDDDDDDEYRDGDDGEAELAHIVATAAASDNTTTASDNTPLDDEDGGAAAAVRDGSDSASLVTPSSDVAALPRGWIAATSDGGHTYYVSTVSGEVQWEVPRLPATAALPPLPANWVELQSEAGQIYYANTLTSETSWTRPTLMEMPAAATDVLVDDSDEDVTLPLPWERRCGLEGQAVYYNTLTHESQRHFPGTDPPAVAAVPKGGDGLAKKRTAEEMEGLVKADGKGKPMGKAKHAQPDSDTKKKKKKNKNKNKWKEMKTTTYVYVTGLPLDVRADEVGEYFKKCGVLKQAEDGSGAKVKVYTDEKGKPKGDARVGYIKVESVQLAVQLLDQTEFRPGATISVKQAEFQKNDKLVVTKADAPKAMGNDKKSKADLFAKRKLQEKLAFGWIEKQDDGSGQRIMILQHMFDAAEFRGQAAVLEEFTADIQTECAKFGELEKVTVFDQNPAGVVAVKFRKTECAEDCIQVMDGRWFGGRQVKADLWDGITNYKVDDVVTDTVETQIKRLDEFADWLEKGGAGDGAQELKQNPDVEMKES